VEAGKVLINMDRAYAAPLIKHHLNCLISAVKVIKKSSIGLSMPELKDKQAEITDNFIEYYDNIFLQKIQTSLLNKHLDVNQRSCIAHSFDEITASIFKEIIIIELVAYERQIYKRRLINKMIKALLN